MKKYFVRCICLSITIIIYGCTHSPKKINLQSYTQQALTIQQKEELKKLINIRNRSYFKYENNKYIFIDAHLRGTDNTFLVLLKNDEIYRIVKINTLSGSARLIPLSPIHCMRFPPLQQSQYHACLEEKFNLIEQHKMLIPTVYESTKTSSEHPVNDILQALFISALGSPALPIVLPIAALESKIQNNTQKRLEKLRDQTNFNDNLQQMNNVYSKTEVNYIAENEGLFTKIWYDKKKDTLPVFAVNYDQNQIVNWLSTKIYYDCGLTKSMHCDMNRLKPYTWVPYASESK